MQREGLFAQRLCVDCKKVPPNNKSALCKTCFHKRPTCKGCTMKVAKNQTTGDFYTFCLKCACKKPTCQNAHVKNQDYCRDCLKYVTTCEICHKNQSIIYQNTCTECTQMAECVTCKRSLSDNEQNVCCRCKCDSKNCHNPKLSDSKFCQSCYNESKCQTCDYYHAPNEVLCYQCLKLTYPKCPRCEEHVGYNQQEDTFYATCKGCRCVTWDCPNPRQPDDSAEPHLCEPCASKPRCNATGCKNPCQGKDVYCNLCNKKWNENKIKCSTDNCRNYIPKKSKWEKCKRCAFGSDDLEQ